MILLIDVVFYFDFTLKEKGGYSHRTLTLTPRTTHLTK